MSIQSLGGYRLVRKLGEGVRAEVLLVHPSDATTDSAVAPSQAAGSAMKIYREGTSDESILVEVDALSRGAGPHVVGLLDVVNAPGGAPALIMQRLSGASLARLLADRSTLRPGEAVTILAPLAVALARLHGAGISHGSIRPEAVLFDAVGAPMFACFGRATLFTADLPEAGLAAQPGAAIDVAAFAVLVNRVLERVADPVAVGLFADLEAESPDSRWLESVPGRLFDIADALPIDLSAPIGQVPSSLPNRVITRHPGADEDSPRAGGLVGMLGALVPASITERLPLAAVRSAVPPSVLALVVRVRRALSAVRPRLWVLSGAIGAALLVAVVVVPGSADPESDPSSVDVPAPDPTASSSGDPDGPVTGDDPVAALVALLDAREGCIRDLSVLCLDAVDQQGSSALDDDGMLVRSLQAGDELPVLIDATAATLTERLGDSAIIALGPDSSPASILMMRSEAGWRIRDYIP